MSNDALMTAEAAKVRSIGTGKVEEGFLLF
jgi:hypothetical protein